MKRIIIGVIVLLCSGCVFSADNMENITIYTTTYPIEYITKELYGDKSTVLSIYPNAVIKLSDKLLSDYSKSNLFVYNGLSREKDYAVEMINKNKNLMIVDAAMGMEYTYGIQELWLNPSNFLMLCQNIKNGMKEYISNTYLRNSIDNNYEDVKLEISELDADIKLNAENANDKNVLVANDVFLFLDKYGLNVVSLDEDTITDKKITDATTLITNGNIKYIILLPNDNLTDSVNTLITDKKIEKLYFNPLTIITENEVDNGEDYVTIMNKNIEVLKKELYE